MGAKVIRQLEVILHLLDLVKKAQMTMQGALLLTDADLHICDGASGIWLQHCVDK